MKNERRTRKSPQQKKAESLAKDRRNTYGNSPQAARTTIPKRKQERSQQERRVAKQELGGPAAAIDESRVDAMLDRAAVKRAKAWQKWPDQPLGDVLRGKGRRARSSEAQ